MGVIRHRFSCSNEKIVRDTFENMMLRDLPKGKGIFGQNLYGQGIHLEECGKRIKGFYVHCSEVESARSSPARVSFRGRFVKKKDKTVFEVYVYPRLIEIVFLLFVYVSVSIVADFVGFLLFTVVFVMATVGYARDMKETTGFFERWVR